MKRALISIIVIMSQMFVSTVALSSPSDTRFRISYFSNPLTQSVCESGFTCMVLENFDDFDPGSMTGDSAVGNWAGSLSISDANDYGGAGLTGRFATAVDATLTLPNVERYVGFWWSAGNSENYVELLDDSGVVATVSAAEIAAQIGACDGLNVHCGNPNNGSNTGETYAYVNLRYPAGFSRIRFYGAGFEFDNLAISESVFAIADSETVVERASVNLSCSGISSAQAQAILTACPREITIEQFAEASIDLSDSQISGYSYEAEVGVSYAQIYSGAGTVSSTESGAWNYSSDTVGEFIIEYTIRDDYETSISYVTVTVTPAFMPIPIPPVIAWNSPSSGPIVIYQSAYTPSWSIVDVGGGVGGSGDAVRQVATYISDNNCDSDWVTDLYSVSRDAEDTLSFGHCYRYSFEPAAGGTQPSSAGAWLADTNLTSPIVVIPSAVTLFAPTTIRVDPRSTALSAPRIAITGGDVQACIEAVSSEGVFGVNMDLIFDVGVATTVDSTFSSATITGDRSNSVVITGSASEVSDALSSILFSVSDPRFIQKYFFNLSVGPSVPSSAGFGCDASSSLSRVSSTIDPYGLNFVVKMPISLTQHN